MSEPGVCDVPRLNIRLNARRGETKTEQIFHQIANAIETGKLSPGDFLPSERTLAEQVGASRNVVRAAYRRLADQGMIEAVSTSGTRVLARPKTRRAQTAPTGRARAHAAARGQRS
jgi:GntR family transcriptional regulator/MocR family aminotransferase